MTREEFYAKYYTKAQCAQQIKEHFGVDTNLQELWRASVLENTTTPMNWQKVADHFAHLVVENCIKTIQLGIARDGNNTEKYHQSLKHIKDIQEAFGIKETKGWVCPKCGTDRTKDVCPNGYTSVKCPMIVASQ